MKNPLKTFWLSRESVLDPKQQIFSTRATVTCNSNKSILAVVQLRTFLSNTGNRSKISANRRYGPGRRHPRTYLANPKMETKRRGKREKKCEEKHVHDMNGIRSLNVCFLLQDHAAQTMNLWDIFPAERDSDEISDWNDGDAWNWMIFFVFFVCFKLHQIRWDQKDSNLFEIEWILNLWLFHISSNSLSSNAISHTHKCIQFVCLVRQSFALASPIDSGRESKWTP